MKTLIVSFRAGEGHNAAANAIKEEMNARGHLATVIDFMGLFSDKISNFINNSYVKTVKTAPAAFGAFYKTGMLLSRKIDYTADHHSPIYKSSVIVARRLQKYIEENGPFDCILATHLMPAQALSHLKKEGMKLPMTVSVATDYSCYPFWEESCGVDYCVVPHEAVREEFVRRGFPREKILPLGIPISIRFDDLPDKKAAREKLGLDGNKKYFLIMGGSMGAGHIYGLVGRLHLYLRKNQEIIVITGRNLSLQRRLDAHFGMEKNVHILGFTREVPAYMSACDVLYTKPGGLTSTEALACNIPLIHTAPIPGCETDNFNFFLENGCSLSAKHRIMQVTNGLRLISSPDLIAKVKECQRRCIRPHTARNLCDFIEEHLEK